MSNTTSSNLNHGQDTRANRTRHYFPFWEVGAHLRSRLGCITERPLQLNLCVLPIWQMAVNVNVGTRQMSAFGTADLHGEESLIFGDMAELGGDVSAEERIKSLLGGDPAERGLARRRVVRRPFGSGGYQAQTIVFSERERDGAQSLSSEPFSELLQLAATRSKGQLPLRASRDPAATESGRARVPGGGDGGSGAAVTPAQQLRAAFVQELLLSTLALPTAGLDPGPLDAGL